MKVHSQTNIYLIPGQGSDARIFKDLQLDSTLSVHHIKYSTPPKKMSMNGFAQMLSTQIDTSKPFILIGVSLGGMLAIEMNSYLNPIKTIIISSAKNRNELPFQYRFQKTVPIYKLVPKRLIKVGARILQPIVEPDRKHNKKTFKAMLKDKDPTFLKRTIEMIIKWERTITPNKPIYHIHGNEDHTIPIRNIQNFHLIDKGSHMMTLTRATEIGEILDLFINRSVNQFDN